ncbi:MAG: hypothetical protein DRN27_10340, partial [Thermoplasmata archaeon]
SSRDGITGNIIYPFEKGYFIGIGDVIGNEKEEIFTCYSIDYVIILCCIDASDGSILWECNLDTYVIESISIGDANGDSNNEVVVGIRNDVVCINGNTGEIIWRKHLVDYPYSDILCTEISDVNKDGNNEIIACSELGEEKVFCLNGNTGEIIWNFSRSKELVIGFRSLCIDNLNDDPYLEIIVEGTPDDNYTGILCLSGYNGKVLWFWEEEPQIGSFQSILATDIIPTRPGKELIVSGVGGIYCLYGGDTSPSAGRVIWHAGGYKINNIIQSMIMSAAIGDLDGDGLLDVVGHGGGMYALNGQYGSLLWNYGHIKTDFQDFVFCVDLNNDNIDEVVSVNTDFDERVIYDVAALQSKFPQENQVPEIPLIDGKAQVKINEIYEYSASSSDQDDDNIYYYFDWGDGTGEISTMCESGESITITHYWKNKGTFIIKVKTIDEHGLDSDYSTPLIICVSENSPPNKPLISGPSQGKPYTTYTFTTSTIDSDGDTLYYWFDWDDGTNSGWIGAFKSGIDATESHLWNNKDRYNIKVKAKDDHGAESEWTNLEISIPKSRIKENLLNHFLANYPHLFPLLQLFLGLS